MMAGATRVLDMKPCLSGFCLWRWGEQRVLGAGQCVLYIGFWLTSAFSPVHHACYLVHSVCRGLETLQGAVGQISLLWSVSPNLWLYLFAPLITTPFFTVTQWHEWDLFSAASPLSFLVTVCLSFTVTLGSLRKERKWEKYIFCVQISFSGMCATLVFHLTI